MDKQTVQGEGSKSGRKARAGQAETPVVGSEGAEVTEAAAPVDTTPKRPVDEQYKEIQARISAAEETLKAEQKAMTGLANRVNAAGSTQITVDGKTLFVRHQRDSEDCYFYDPSLKPAKAKKGPVDAATLLV